jgi:hypothetical protein
LIQDYGEKHVRNFIGALFGIIIGSFVIVTLASIPKPPYPSPYDALWILLAGCQALQITGQQLLTVEHIPWYIITWLLVGIVTSPFSDSHWSAVRTATWVGVLITLFALVSLLLLNPAFWLSDTRNWELVIQLATSVVTSFLSLISSVPLVLLISKIQQQSEPPVPEKIETICECGAIFKSRPLICSECGKVLHNREY